MASGSARNKNKFNSNFLFLNHKFFIKRRKEISVELMTKVFINI